MPAGQWLGWHHHSGEEKVLEGVDNSGKVDLDDEAWVPTELMQEPSVLEVTQTKNSFCEIDVHFSVPLDPDGVYDILTDPNNHRVFKNIKEVTYRKVLENDGNQLLVELEQLGRWQFLVFSGSFSSRMIIKQNRREHSVLFDLARQGVMRRFSGSWKLEPLQGADSDSKPQATGTENSDVDKTSDPTMIGTWVHFHQVLEPTLMPPWPLKGYLRRVTEKVIREMLGDLQRECLRLSECKKLSLVKT